MKYPVTEDGRYFLVKGRLWRCTNPELYEVTRQMLVQKLMNARRAVKVAAKGSDEMRSARQTVNAAKIALGERGPVWWSDGAPDYNRHLATNTPYGAWAQSVGSL